MGHRPDSRLLSRGTHFTPCATSPDQMNADRVKSWHREELEEEAPLLFFHFGAHIKQRYPSHPLPPPTAPPPPPLCGFLTSDRESSKSARVQKIKNRDALPHLKTVARGWDSELWLWFPYQCWRQMEESRGDWSPLQLHIPSNIIFMSSTSP